MMRSALKLFACATVALLLTFHASNASTIIKLNLGGVGPDIGMNGAGILSTVDDGIAGTTGDQNTAIEYTSFLDWIPDIDTATGSFSLHNMQEVGAANLFGPIVNQNFNGGQFDLYDPANNLLLSGPLTNSAVSGVIGPPGTGAIFTTTLGNISGGSLAPYITQGSVSLSISLTTVNGGNGFSVSGLGPHLDPFVSDATGLITGLVPEPASILLALSCLVVPMLLRRR